MSDERRTSERRRRRGGGCRIVDLASHEAGHVTLRALCDYLAVDRRTVLKWINVGLLVAHRFPNVSDSGVVSADGEWRIKTADAIAFIERQRIQPNSQDPLPNSP